MTKKNYAFEKAAYQAYVQNGNDIYPPFDELKPWVKESWSNVVDLIVGITIDQIDEKSVRNRVKKQ